MRATPRRRRAAAAAATAAVALVLPGCGDAGGRAVERPPVATAPSPAPIAPPAVGHPVTPAKAAPADPRPRAAPREVAVAEPATTAPRPATVLPTPGRAASGPAAAPAVAPTEAVLALPPPGSRVYDVTGTTSLGPPPPTMTLAVDDAADSPLGQRWTFEARTAAGNGVVEEFALGRRTDGVYLSAYRLELSKGLTVTFDFAPDEPVLLLPDRPTGPPWSFDLLSTDGCARLRTQARSVPTRGGGTQIRLVSALAGTHEPACVEVDIRRVLGVRHAPGSALPTRLDSDLDGSVGGLPVTARTTARLRPE